MDKAKGKSAEIEEWMKQLMPDGTADVGSSVWQHAQRTSADRPNTYQLSVDSNTYSCNLSQYQILQTPPTSNSSSLMVKQEPFNVLQHSARQTTLQKILETQSGIPPEHHRSRLQMPTFHQSQNLTLADQLKPGNQSQPVLLGPLQASSDSTPQVDLTSSVDWVNQAFHKIQQMKEMYLSDLLSIHNRAQEMRLRATDAETVNKWEKTRSFSEKMTKFLNTSRSELFHWRKEKLFQTINDVMKCLYRFRLGNSFQLKQAQQVEVNHSEPRHQIQQRENYLHPQSLNQSLKQVGALSLPQTSLSSINVSSSMANASRYNLVRRTQQWAPQGCVTPSPHKGLQPVFDQSALRMLLHPATGVSQHNNLCNSQHTVASSRNIFNSLDYSTCPVAQTTPISISPSLNNQQDQVLKRQKMKQPVQQLASEKNKQQKRNEDIKLRRFVGFNQRWSPALQSSSSSYTISPQNSQQSSSQLELKDFSSKLSKSTTPSLSASPSALPSPLTPLTPSSNPADSVKSPSIEESSKIARATTPVRFPLPDKNQGQVSIDAQRLIKSCLHRESTCSGDKQPSRDKVDPVKRLVDVVKTISSRALNATLRDITVVTNFSDRMAGHFLHGDPAKVVLHDLADDISNPDNGMSSMEERSGMELRLKRGVDSVALDEPVIDTEFYEIGRVKRLKIEPNNMLLQEIKEINNKLVEVVVDVMKVEDISRIGSYKGTLIRCSYIPIGISRNIKTPNTSKLMFPKLLLDLVVSTDYPNSSPTVLEKMPSGYGDCEGWKYLWMKAKSSLGLSLRKLSQHISVKEIAETWDVCAREVFHEFAEQLGGGNFSSTYGKWENCAVAS